MEDLKKTELIDKKKILEDIKRMNKVEIDKNFNDVKRLELIEDYKKEIKKNRIKAINEEITSLVVDCLFFSLKWSIIISFISFIL